MFQIRVVAALVGIIFQLLLSRPHVVQFRPSRDNVVSLEILLIVCHVAVAHLIVYSSRCAMRRQRLSLYMVRLSVTGSCRTRVETGLIHEIDGRFAHRPDTRMNRRHSRFRLCFDFQD